MLHRTAAIAGLWLVLALVLLTAGGASARVALGEKTYNATGSDAGGDKLTALQEAFCDAVDQAVVELVPDEQARAKHADTIDRAIVAKARDEEYILEYGAVDESDAGGYTISLPVTVDVRAVNLDLIINGVKVVPLTIMCVVPLTVVDETAVPSWEAQTVVEDALAASGYTVRTAVGAGLDDLINVASGEVNSLKAVEAAKKEKADVVIVGQAVAERAGKQGKRFIIRASCSLRGILVQTGQVFGAQSGEGTEQDTSVQIGARRAAKTACENALDLLLDAFPPAGDVEVTFSKLFSRTQFDALSKGLKSIDMVKDVVLGDADFGAGVVTFRVATSLDSDLLSTALRRIEFPPVEIDTIESMRIAAQIPAVCLVINDLERSRTLDDVEKELQDQSKAAGLKLVDRADKEFDKAAKRGALTVFGLTAEEVQRVLDEVRWIRVKSFKDGVAEIEVFEK